MDKIRKQRKQETASTDKPAGRLTPKVLENLKANGYRYVVVEGYTVDRRQDFIEMNHFVLRPLKELPDLPGDLGIFEPIDSPILDEWANAPDNGILAFIESNNQTA